LIDLLIDVSDDVSENMDDVSEQYLITNDVLTPLSGQVQQSRGSSDVIAVT